MFNLKKYIKYAGISQGGAEFIIRETFNQFERKNVFQSIQSFSFFVKLYSKLNERIITQNYNKNIRVIYFSG